MKEPGDVIAAIKLALRSSLSHDLPLKIQEVELTLKAVVARDAGAGFKLKIPLIDLELSAGVDYSETSTQTLYFKFALPTEEQKSLVEPELIDELKSAIESFRAAVGVAEDARLGPVLNLQGGCITLDFVFNTEGKIELISRVKLSSNVTNTIVIHYSAAGSGKPT